MGDDYYFAQAVRILQSGCMELGLYPLQVFTSLVVILGAALVALICDFLKGNNEQLRELNIELKVRREEEHKRMQLMLPQAAVAQAAATGVAAAGASVPRREHAPRSLAIPKERKRTAAPEAIAAMERGAQLAGLPRTPRVPARVPSPSPSKPQLVETPSRAEIEPQRIPEQVLVQAMAASSETRPAASSAVPTQAAAKKDWGSLLAAKRTPAPPPEQSPLLTAVMEATASDRFKTAAEAL